MVWETIEVENEFWKPKTKEEQIAGRVALITSGEYGKNYHIEDKENNTHITPSHKLLQKLLENINLNDVVRITYKGSEETKKGNDVEIYKVEVWRTEAPL